MSQDSSVGIVMGYRLDGRGSIPNRSKIFFSTPQCPGHKADHIPSYSVEVKNGGTIPPIPRKPSWLGA
jgi:hypothetical protein